MRLIIIAGLPGVGKSHTARILEERLGAYYFDSDRFAKEHGERAQVDITRLSGAELVEKRLEGHRAKIDGIIRLFDEHETILLDTCFDMVESRALFTTLEHQDIELVIVELTCSDETVHERIFGNEHETDRMIGTPQSRYEAYERMKANWVPIERVDYHIVTDEDYDEQIERLVAALSKPI